MKMIQTTTVRRWCEIYKLYRNAFPRNERKPFHMILKMQIKGKTDVWYFEKDGKFVGLAITINGPDMILLDYLAIAENARGCGVGTKILRKLQKHYGNRGLLIEIETIQGNAPNLTERKRRKNFYLKNRMRPMNVFVKLFGVEMELMGYNCQVTFDDYFTFYRKNYGEFITSHITEVSQ